MYVYNALGMVVKCEFLFPQSIVSLLAIQIFKGKKSYKEEIPRVNTPTHPHPPAVRVFAVRHPPACGVRSPFKRCPRRGPVTRTRFWRSKEPSLRLLRAPSRLFL